MSDQTSVFQVTEGGIELTLGDIVGLFYLLLFALVIGLITAVIEFCNYHRSAAARANISIKTALRAKSRMQLNEPLEARNTTRRRRRREQERPLNGTGTAPGPYAGVSGFTCEFIFYMISFLLSYLCLFL